MATKTAASDRLSARERLLNAAEELFYEEGPNTVGIERVIERAGVAKASLYNTFGSKEELVRSYLEARHDARKARLTAKLERYTTAREKLLGVFDSMGELFAEPTYRGCAFMRASAEIKAGGSVKSVCDNSRSWTRDLFRDLAQQAGARDPDRLARQLVLLYDGANTSAYMDRDPTAAAAARDTAELLLNEAMKK